jgi:biotin carboxyl carrier protein
VKLVVEIAGAERSVEIQRAGSRIVCAIDGRAVEADVVDLGDGVYSFILGGHSIEVRVEARAKTFRVTSGGREFVAAVRDPRRYRPGAAGAAAEGRQHVNAPMPGKVVHLLVGAGEIVEAGQGLLVVEAMKMQNEIRSPKAGTVEKLLVAEGQAVNAGDTLAIIV